MKLTTAVTVLFLSFASLIIGPSLIAQAATRIQFAAGSYCGSYSGNFAEGREFVLNLRRGQTFTSKNTGGGTQYDIYVSGPTGRISGRKVSSSQINYYIPESGDYYIYIKSTVDYSAVEFCAY